MKKAMYLLTLLFFLVASMANAGELQKVSLQLRWDHQFQFAGYYAAKWQGYYKAAGFDVDIRSALKPDGTILKTVTEVSEGRADFGIGAADILVGIDQGVPLVVLASIFQQSAAEFYAKEGTVFNSPADLLNLKVARNLNDLIDVELQAMLFAEGINPNKITPYKHESGIEHIIDSRVDVIPGYRLGAPYEFRLQGIKVKRLRPIAYGIDFYGDSLFTHSRLIEKDPAAVERFRLATLQGWQYALEHPEEIANRIVSELPRTANQPRGNIQEFNKFQIQPVKELTLYPFVETGNMNPLRWQQMYELLQKSGVVKGKFVVSKHIFDFNSIEQAKKERLFRYITITVVLCFCILIISLVFIFLLRRQVRSKTLSVVEAAEQHRSVAHELKISEERFRLILETVAVVPWEFNIPENRWTYVGPQVTDLMGYAPEEWTTLEWWHEIIHPEDQAWVPVYCADRTSRGEEHSMEYRLRTKDGSFVWVNDLVTVEMLDGKPHIMRGVIIDITERKKSNELLKNALRDMPIAVAMIDNQQVAIFRNRRFVELFGYTEEDIKTAADWWYLAYPDEQYRLSVMDTWGRAVKKAVDEGTYVEKAEYSVTCKDGTTRIVEASGVPLGTSLLITFNDVTEQRAAEKERLQLENQLHQAQKIESVGRLAGGVAHDFNNMLGVILGHTHMAQIKIESDQPIYANLEEIRLAAERSADLTRQLLAFARKQTIAPKVLDLNDVVAGMLKMLQRMIGENTKLIWQPSAELWPLKVDPSQIDQILANLCVNARDSLSDNGRIVIETSNCTVDEHYAQENPDAAHGDYVILTVSDNGCGMDRETMTHIFEPFFTTKGVGEGTGLGLATVYGAVKQNGGFITVYSEPGKGTSFSVYLPRESNTGTARRIPTDAETAVPRGQETILLVEDEAAILNITAIMLEKQGYSVLRAESPGRAMELAREHVGTIHLLMTDVIMPEMNGRDLARNILVIHPAMKRLFMSGYTADVIAHHGVLDEGVHFIQKPFSLPIMAAMVREVLDKA